MQFLNEKNEYLLIEVTEEQPVKVVLKGLPVEMDTSEIQGDLTRNGFPINRIPQMRNHRMKILHRFNTRDLYLIIKVEPYKRKTRQPYA
ncbi:hypothetical protein AVEN_273124-1 [Araneus ventricosus]|uniref:Pre-C2HC domain-containing protein n=1 Tax=Araneus ventricosus TaxID=182803 RepID=A0A4Y2WMB5_ARAVE|nr:hypothetical protein AVEN_224346-1 [Araneus ventricosus]GBO37658.1 hypothetical protein AVEN_175014-1 [Araneus ventricosus]GBO37729.1 hypothetical protein AVEN_269181-1 [Araneus ventricosus]GBO37744.1 hypothetical protein AVEN_273124-1 [Araneus ventricosus]